MDDLNSSGYWVYSSGILDYEHECLTISVGASGSNFQMGAVQYWVKQACLDSYGEAAPLAPEDLIIEKWDGEKYTQVDCNYAIYNSYVFPHFFDDGSAPPEKIVKLRDGITLGSSLEEVLDVYGYGIGRPYASGMNPLRSTLEYNQLHDDLAAYDDQVLQMVYMDSTAYKCLILGFDSNNELNFIAAAPAYLYWK